MKKLITTIVFSIICVYVTQSQTIQKKVQSNTNVQQAVPLKKTNTIIKKIDREPITNIKVQPMVPAKKNNTVIKKTAVKPSSGLSALNDGFIKKPIQLPFSSVKKEYFVKKAGNYYLLNGDIIVHQDNPYAQYTMSAVVNTKDKDYKWPDAKIPVVIDESIFVQKMDKVVYNALNQMNKKLELQVIARTNEKDYVRINYSPDLNGAAGSSFVGRRGGEQSLLLTKSAREGVIWHELLHAAGVYHEQSRDDRDKFIKLDSQNIREALFYNFQIEPSSSSIGSYDYCSIMHYPSNAFAKDISKPTITCISNGTDVPCPPCMGGSADFSPSDIAGLDAFYNEVKRTPGNYAFTSTMGADFTRDKSDPEYSFSFGTLRGLRVIVDRADEEYLPVQPFKNSVIRKIPTTSAETPKENAKIESRISDLQVATPKSQTKSAEVLQPVQSAKVMRELSGSYAGEVTKLKEIPNGTSYQHLAMFTEDHLRRYGPSGAKRMGIYANLHQAFLKAFNTALKNESYYSELFDLKTQIGDYFLMRAEYWGGTKTPAVIIVTMPRNTVEVVLSHNQFLIKSLPKFHITFDLRAIIPVQLPANTSQVVKLGATQVSIFNLEYKVSDDRYQIGALLAKDIMPHFTQSAFANELQKNAPLLFASSDYANQNLEPIRREGYLRLPPLRIDHATSLEGDLLLIATNKKIVPNRVN